MPNMTNAHDMTDSLLQSFFEWLNQHSISRMSAQIHIVTAAFYSVYYDTNESAVLKMCLNSSVCERDREKVCVERKCVCLRVRCACE